MAMKIHVVSFGDAIEVSRQSGVRSGLAREGTGVAAHSTVPDRLV
jgi:hypothetical protein